MLNVEESITQVWLMKLPQLTSPKTVNLPSQYPMMEGFFFVLLPDNILLEIF
jgi:hypothetical protein